MKKTLKNLKKNLHRFWLWLTRPAALIEWVGTGAMPVTRLEATGRAQICFGCRLNRNNSKAAQRAVSGLKKWLEIKNRMKLRVYGEKYLHRCDGCHCYLPLKIWVPYGHIKRWQRQAEADRMRSAEPKCWQI